MLPSISVTGRWLVSLHGQPFREVATEELAMLDPDAHCWTEGLSDWVPVHALGSAPARGTHELLAV